MILDLLSTAGKNCSTSHTPLPTRPSLSRRFRALPICKSNSCSGVDQQPSKHTRIKPLIANSTMISKANNNTIVRPYCRPCKRAGHWEDRCWILHPHLKEIWRKENPEKAAELDTRSIRRKDFRKQRRTHQNSSSLGSALSPAAPSATTTDGKPPTESR